MEAKMKMKIGDIVMWKTSEKGNARKGEIMKVGKCRYDIQELNGLEKMKKKNGDNKIICVNFIRHNIWKEDDDMPIFTYGNFEKRSSSTGGGSSKKLYKDYEAMSEDDFMIFMKKNKSIVKYLVKNKIGKLMKIIDKELIAEDEKIIEENKAKKSELIKAKIEALKKQLEE